MQSLIFDKADKGREEISTRKYQLPPKLRTLLVMIDGKHTVCELLKKISTLGLNENSIRELLDRGLIAVSANSPAADEALSPSELLDEVLQIPQTPAKEAAPVNATSKLQMNDAQRFQAVYTFYNETVKTTLGFRGITLQLKVERAGNLQELEEIRRPFIEAVLKIKGKEMALSLRDRLDQLLFEKSSPDTIIPENF